MSESFLRKTSTAVLGAACFYTAQVNGYLYPAFKVATGIAAVALGLLYWNQGRILYIPDPDPVNFPRKHPIDPSAYNLPFENVNIKASDGASLTGWFIKQRKEEDTKKSITVLYFHANAGGINHRLQLYEQMWRSLDVNVLAAEYRGFGHSDGEPSEEGLKQDTFAFHEFLKTHPLVDESKIILFGRSLGGAVAIHLASELSEKNLHLKGIILENTFTSIREMATTIMPFLKPIGRFLQRPLLVNEWKSAEAMEKIKKTPILFISGRDDELVPKEHMDNLFIVFSKGADEEVKAKSKFYAVDGGHHNDTPLVAGENYFLELNRFIAKL